MSQESGWSVPAGLAAPSGPYSLAARTVEGLVHTAGLVALGAGGEPVGAGDPGAQTREIFRQAEEILGAAGSGLQDVIFAHVFVSDMAHYAAMNGAYREAFAATGGPLPPRYCIRADLVRLDLLVEIAFVARKGG